LRMAFEKRGAIEAVERREVKIALHVANWNHNAEQIHRTSKRNMYNQRRNKEEPMSTVFSRNIPTVTWESCQDQWWKPFQKTLSVPFPFRERSKFFSVPFFVPFFLTKFWSFRSYSVPHCIISFPDNIS
jgi:hypothetical protein